MDDLVKRYLDMENSGTGIYFDADDIVELLDYFEEIDDLDHFKKVLKIGEKLHPYNIDIKIRICKAYIYDNDYEKALSMIELLNDISNHELNLLKFECLCALDRYNELLTCLETMQNDSMEELQDVYEYLTMMLREQYNSKNAYDLVRRGQVLFPDSVILKEELCYHLDNNGDTEKAVEICKELIDYDPYSVDYWYILGRLYAIMGIYDKAIDAFDFALVCDNSDLEVKILKAFCYLLCGNYEKLVEVFKAVFPDDNKYIVKFISPYLNAARDADYAYMLLKKMIKRYDNQDTDDFQLLMSDNKDTEEINGLLSIADCFPSSVVFLLCKELQLMAEGKEDTLKNVEQIIQFIYQKGTDNENFRLDIKSKLYKASKQKIELIYKQQMPCIESGEHDDCLECNIIRYLLDGNISMFCQLYIQTSPEAIFEHLGKVFPAATKRNKQKKGYLRSGEIFRNYHSNISSNKLTEKFITDKNLHN